MKQITVPQIDAVAAIEEITLAISAPAKDIAQAHQLARILEVPIVFVMDMDGQAGQ